VVTTTQPDSRVGHGAVQGHREQHFRFKVPLWQVQGTTFLGIGSDETTAVFFIAEEAAEAAAAADPDHAATSAGAA
jgi:hypothetical protein